jgi:serine/threonine protein kinase
VEPLADDDPREIGGYRLLGRLGAGGMGLVYLGRTAVRRVAVKVMHGSVVNEPGFRDRFAREVELARRVSGPYTASVLDADPRAEEPWLVTEYVSGLTLAETVQKHGPLTPAQALFLAVGLAEALRAIHREGVVHRDLKPGNVILAEDGPRVIDFGIAKALSGFSEASLTPLTPLGGRFGTPPYMSPEQVLGEEIGFASDVFSLGSVLYFAVTGDPPFGKNGLVVLKRVLDASPARTVLPVEVRALVMSCLEREPAYRTSLERLIATVGPRRLDGDDWPPGAGPARSGPVQRSSEFAPPRFPAPGPKPAPPADPRSEPLQPEPVPVGAPSPSPPPERPPAEAGRPGEPRRARGTRWRSGGLPAGVLAVLAVAAYAFGPDWGGGGNQVDSTEASGVPEASRTASAERPAPSESEESTDEPGDESREEVDDSPSEEAAVGDVPSTASAGDPCRPEDVAVTFDFAESDREVYGGGVSPEFRVTVVNTADQTCTVDVGPEAFELRIESGDDRVYSTADCVEGDTREERQLRRGTPHDFTIIWGLDRSFADCRNSGARAQPGWYRASLYGDHAGGVDQLVFQLKA